MNKDSFLHRLTDKQKEVVLANLDSDILVSASAGSGKTHVLSERIAYRICEHSIDLNRVLILTFTEAASMSMKKRIEDKINFYLYENKKEYLFLRSSNNCPKDELIKVQGYIENLKEASDNLSICNISTFHSYCKSLIDQNLSQLNDIIERNTKLKESVKLRPSYTILDEAHSDALLTKACKQVLSRFYQIKDGEGEKSSRESFFALTQLLGSGKNDNPFISFIKQLHRKLRTYPNYLHFFNSSVENLNLLIEKPNESEAFFLVHKYVKKIVKKFRLEIETVNDILQSELDSYITNKDYLGASDRELCIFYALYLMKNIIENLQSDYLGTEDPAENECSNMARYKELFDKFVDFSKQWHLVTLLMKIRKQAKSDEEKNIIEDFARNVIDFLCNGNEIVVNEALLDKFKLFKTIRLSKDFPFVYLMEMIFELDPLFYFLFGYALRQSSAEKIYRIDFHPYKYSVDLISNELKSVIPLLKLLGEILEEMDLAYKRLESSENALDFADLIHYALMLIENNTAYFSACYDEVYIDEYQDTSAIQERLFYLLAHGKRFMVGDMKQSIYRFQGAKIDNFRKKEIISDNEDIQVFHLNTNFRTESNLLVFINALFKEIMTVDLGEVRYDESQIMNPKPIESKDVEVKKTSFDNYVKIINLETLDKKQLGEDFINKYKDTIDKNKLEFRDLIKHEENMPYYFISEYIEQIISSSQTDNSTEPSTYSDIAILSRNNYELQKIANVLALKNIPVTVEYEVGETYSERELETLIRLIDNPNQDNVFVAFLLSDLNKFRFTHKELAEIKAEAKLQKVENVDFYWIFQQYENFSRNENLKTKVISQLNWLSLLLAEAKYRNFYELLLNLYTELDYHRTCSLRDEAFEEWYFAKQFLQYISKMKEAAELISIDLVRELETNTLSNIIKTDNEINNDSVRLLTYHKSKGLEFKEVILYMGQGKLNTKDKNGLVCIDENFGLSSYSLINNFGFKYKNFWRQFYYTYNLDYEFSEELRIIYVALTRAKKGMHIILKSDVNNNLLSDLNTRVNFKYLEAASNISTIDKIEDYLLKRNKIDEYYNLTKSISPKNKFVQSISDWIKVLLIKSQVRSIDKFELDLFRQVCRFIPEASLLNLVNFKEVKEKIKTNTMTDAEILHWLDNKENNNNNLQVLCNDQSNILYMSMTMDREFIYNNYSRRISEDTSSIKVEILNRLKKIDLKLNDVTDSKGNSIDSKLKQEGMAELLDIFNRKLTFNHFVRIMKNNPLASLNNLPSKYAASTLSHINIENIKFYNKKEEEFDVEEYLESEEIVNLYPSIDEKMLKIDDFDNKIESINSAKYFTKDSSSNEFLSIDFSPSEKGTIFHKCMRYLDFDLFYECNDYSNFVNIFDLDLKRIRKMSLLFESEVHLIKNEYMQSIYSFFINGIRKNIFQKLDENEETHMLRRIYKEKSFTMKADGEKYIGRGAAFSNFNYPIYIQGVIDFIFIDGEEAIIIDYKTDLIKGEFCRDSETIQEFFHRRYSKQLDIYKEAVEKALKIKVNKKYIYSVSLQNFVEI